MQYLQILVYKKIQNKVTNCIAETERIGIQTSEHYQLDQLDAIVTL